MKLNFTLLILSAIAFAPFANAASGPSSFSYEGRIYDTAGNPSTDTVTINVKVLTPDKACVLRDEDSSLINLSTTDGYFSVNVGEGSATAYDPGLALVNVFSNSSSLVGKLPGSASNCTTYTPAALDKRYVRITVIQGGTTTVMSPEIAVTSTPFSMVADTLQGKTPSNFVQTVATLEASPGTTQSRFTRVIDTDYGALDLLLLGTSTLYAKATPLAAVNNNGQRLTSVADPTVAQDAATKNYVDTKIGGVSADPSLASLSPGDSGKVLSWNGTSWVALPAGAGDFLKDGSVNMTGPMKALDGSQTAPGYAFVGSTNSGLFYVAGSMGLSYGGNQKMAIHSSGVGINKSTTPTGMLDVKGSIVMSGSSSGYVGFQPQASAGSTIYTLPSSDGTSNQVLQTTGAGVLQWATMSGGAAIGTFAGMAMGADAVPNCTAAQKLQMSAGPTYSWSCVVDDNVDNTRVSKAGDTMTGTLNLPAGGLIVGASELYVNGNVGIGTASPTQKLQVVGGDIAVGSTNGYRIGAQSILRHTVSSGNLALGVNAVNIAASGAQNIGIGTNALGGLSTGNDNVSIGPDALDALNTGAFNVAIGTNALGSLTANTSNTAIGYSAGAVVTGANNTMIGYNAGNTTTFGNSNIIIGANAVASTPGMSNSLVIGSHIFGSNTGNIGFGVPSPVSSLQFNGTTARDISVERNIGSIGNSLTLLAGGAGSGTTNTAGGDLFLSSGVATGSSQSNIQFKTAGGGGSGSTDSNPAVKMIITGTGKVGVGTVSPTFPLQVNGTIAPVGDGTFDIGGPANRYLNIYATSGVVNTSDARQKREILDSDLGLNFISKLRPVSYYWKKGGDNYLHYGVIAQETERALASIKAESGRVHQVDNVIVTHDEKTDAYGVRYSELIAPLIKAVQELYASLTKTDERVAQLEAENAALKEAVCELNPNAKFCSAR